jgi:hypothetical protein
MAEKSTLETRQASKATRDKHKPRQRLSLHPLNLETAFRAAMQTGAPPKDGRTVAKRKEKT